MPRIVRIALMVAATIVLLGPVARSQAATLVPIGSFERPIFVTSDPTNPDRLFVVEREGRVLVASGTGHELFGELEALVSCCTSERGLLSIALAPDFAATERFYAAYTGTVAAGGAEGDVHLDAFRPSPAGGGELLREPILTIGHAAEPNHNGGQLQFGPDGYLYISTGDGGGGGDPDGNGQDLTRCSASCCGSTSTRRGPRLRDARAATRSPARPPGGTRSGATACATRGASPSTARPATCHRRRRPGCWRGGRLPAAPGVVGGAASQLRLGLSRGADRIPERPSRLPRRRRLHRSRLRLPARRSWRRCGARCSITGGYVVRDPGLGSLWPLPVRGLLQGESAFARPPTHARGHRRWRSLGGTPGLLRRGRLRSHLRRLEQRRRLPHPGRPGERVPAASGPCARRGAAAGHDRAGRSPATAAPARPPRQGPQRDPGRSGSSPASPARARSST